MNYNPNFFNPKDFEDAKNIVLTQEGCTSEWRWEVETRWNLQMIDTFWNVNEDSVVLDFGCGCGRMSKALIDAFGCRVVGVDISGEMLKHAVKYVDDERFTPMMASKALSSIEPNTFSHAIAIWVFQHSINIQEEIPFVKNILKDDGQFFVVENVSKAIPSEERMKFFNDGVPTLPLLQQNFGHEANGKIPLKFTTKRIHEHSWWVMLKKEKTQ